MTGGDNRKTGGDNRKTGGDNTMSKDEGPNYELNSKPETELAIILDLDETLVHTFRDHPPWISGTADTARKFLNHERIYNCGPPDHIWGVERPYLHSFLEWSFNFFRVVAIWSAGEHDYVHEVLDQILVNHYHPAIIWTREDLHITDKDEMGYKTIEEMAKLEPELDKYINVRNTVLVDDLKHNARYNERNLINIPPYRPTKRQINKEDDALQRVKNWFIRNKDTEDVRKVPKPIFN